MNDGYNEFGMDERKFRQCNTAYKDSLARKLTNESNEIKRLIKK